MSLDALQGEWEIVTASEAGRVARPSGSRLVIRGSRFDRVTPTHVFQRTIQVADSVKPHQIDLFITNEPQRGSQFFGIYKIEANELTICHAPVGVQRPGQFSSTAANGFILSISRRLV